MWPCCAPRKRQHTAWTAPWRTRTKGLAWLRGDTLLAENHTAGHFAWGAESSVAEWRAGAYCDGVLGVLKLETPNPFETNKPSTAGHLKLRLKRKACVMGLKGGRWKTTLSDGLHVVLG